MIAISTAAGVPWPLTSAISMPQLAVGQREEVVVVAAGPLRRLVVGGQVDRRDRRHRLRQERPLDVGDHLHFAVDGLVRLASARSERTRLCVARPNRLLIQTISGNCLPVEGGRLACA